MEKKYKFIAENTSDYVAILTLGGILTYISPSHRELGYEPEELLGKSVLDMVHPEDKSKLLSLLKQYGKLKITELDKKKAEEVAEHVGFRFSDKNGNWRYIEATANLVKSLSEKGYDMLTISRDVTERKLAEEELRESEKRYKLLLEAASEGIVVADIKTKKFKYANPAICEMLGYTREELVQMGVEDIHPKDSVKHAISEFESQARGEKIRVPGMPCLRKDGTIRFADIDSTTVMIDGQEHMLGLFRDTTEQKRIREKLQKSENKYKTLLSNLPQKIFLKDMDSVYVSCNEHYARDLKTSAEEIIGKTDYDFFSGDLAEKYRADDRSVLGSGKTTDIEESYIQDGMEIIVHTVKTPVKDAKGHTAGVLGIFWDITTQKKAELEILEHREKLDKINKELKWKIEELEAALNHIKRLEGMIPICMNCKKMRLEGKDPKDPEAWVSIEKYISTETDASLTHGLCPECVKKLYGK